MSATKPSFHRYRVRRGDSLWKIAAHAYGHGDLWEEISQANHLRPGRPILVGQELAIPVAHTTVRSGRHPAFPGMPVNPTLHSTSTSTNAPAVGALRMPSAQTGHPSIAAVSRSGPFQLARPVLFPAFKYKFERVAFEFPSRGLQIKLSFNGELTGQKQGVITGGLTLTPQGIEVEYKKEADGVLRDFFEKCNGTIENGAAKVSVAMGAVVRSGDQVLATAEVELAPPSGFKYTYKPKEIKFTYRGFDFTGVLGYVLEYQKDLDPTSESPVPAHATDWKRVVGLGLIVLGGALIVGDIIKDVGTVGVGTVESPITFAAALRLFTAGAGMMSAVAH